MEKILRIPIDPFDHNRFIGYLSFVSPSFCKVHFPSSTLLTKFRHAGEELHAGNVGSYVAIEGENFGFLGRMVEISLPEKERLSLSEKSFQLTDLHPSGKIELLLSFDYFERKVRKGLDQFPSVGCKVFICPNSFLQEFLGAFGAKDKQVKMPVLLDIASLSQDHSTRIRIASQALFGRHCAIVGTTGGGKSCTVSRLIEETIKHAGKAILIDPTDEFKEFDGKEAIQTCAFGADGVYLHYSNLNIADLFVLFRPSEQTQMPKLQEALRSLRIVKLIQQADNSSEKSLWIDQYGRLIKRKKNRNNFLKLAKSYSEAEKIGADFDIRWLPYQVMEECVWEADRENPDAYGDINDRDSGWCQTLILRINSFLNSPIFPGLFGVGKDKSGPNEIDTILSNFLADESKSLLRISVSEIPFEFRAREILVNALGRNLLDRARHLKFRDEPLLLFLDEAHQFLNKRISGDYGFQEELDSFDNIAKEARKYGLFLVLSTQMPRDLPVGTLSQVGTFIAHRLINPKDKEAVESACSEASGYSLSYLPVLGEGEAILMGVDFPMPVLMKVTMPTVEPVFDTPIIFQKVSTDSLNTAAG